MPKSSPAKSGPNRSVPGRNSACGRFIKQKGVSASGNVPLPPKPKKSK